MKKFTAGQIFVAASRRVERLHGGTIGLHDTQISRGHDHDGLIGRIENQTIAGLDLAKLPIIALHGLLRGDQARLQFGHRLQVLADREHSSPAAEQNGGEFHRNFEPARKSLIDLAEGRNAAGARIVDHPLYFVAAHVTGDFNPRTADPAIDALALHGRRQGRLADHTLHIQEERYVRLHCRYGGHFSLLSWSYSWETDHPAFDGLSSIMQAMRQRNLTLSEYRHTGMRRATP